LEVTVCERCSYELVHGEDCIVPEAVIVCPVCDGPLRFSVNEAELHEDGIWRVSETGIEWECETDGCPQVDTYEDAINVPAAIYRWALEHVTVAE
jgi:hypothetical protein